MSSPEDKKCRICGYSDIQNVNIFSEAHKSLVNKIRTVFPILLYKNDPLPKNICKKCVATVSFMYVDIQRVMKLQHKWIHNLRCNEPDSNYLCILNMIEMANRGTRQTIKTVLSEDIFMEWIDRVALALPPQEKPTKQLLKNLTSQTTTAATDILPTLIHKNTTTNNNNQNNNNNSNDVGGQNCHSSLTASSIKLESNGAEAVTNENNEQLHDIKSLLASNGCTLLTVQNNKKRSCTSITSSTSHVALEGDLKTRKLSYAKVKATTTTTTTTTTKIKQETITDHEDYVKEENIVLSKRISRQSCAKKSTNAALPVGSKTKKQHDKAILLASSSSFAVDNKCPLCTEGFQTENALAIHQLTHMRLQIPRIFDRKCLSKRERRGRLIMIHAKQCIRCLNCWRIFNDNKSILTHWTMSNCDFYCQICGKEFAHAPKMLREHVPAAHGVSYRSTKMQHQRFAPLPEETEIHIDTSKPAHNAFLVETETKTLSSSTSAIEKSSNTKLKVRKKTPVQADKRAACPICSLWFQNMKARNSHMRKHKIKPKVENTECVIAATQLGNATIAANIKVESHADEKHEITTAAGATTKLLSNIIVNIKTEPLDINDDMEQKCQVCQQHFNGDLQQHACF